VLAEIVRLDRAHHRPVAGDSELGEAIKLVARADQSLIWDRTRHILRLRSVLREFFPAAFEAFADLATPDTLELLAIPPDPDRAARMPKSKIVAVLRRANRRGVEEKAATIESVWRAPALRQPTQVQAAFEVIVTSQGPGHHRVEP
jgi:transposase